MKNKEESVDSLSLVNDHLRALLKFIQEDQQATERVLAELCGGEETVGIDTVETLPAAVRRIVSRLQTQLAQAQERIKLLEAVAEEADYYRANDDLDALLTAAGYPAVFLPICNPLLGGGEDE